MSFKGDYAKFYDILYQDKEYSLEVDFLEKVFRKYRKKKVHTVLDVACGTGGHAIALSERGFEVTGIDLSAEMLERARSKSQAKNVSILFKQSSMQEISLDRTFDAAVVMFSAINYLTDYQDLKDTFAGIRRHLNQDGLLYFDCWNGLAVIERFDPYREKVVKEDDLEVKRVSRTEVDPVSQLCTVDYVLEIFKDGEKIEEFKEIHHLKFFFIDELKNYLAAAGFKVLDVSPFLKIGEPVSKNEWDINFLARKI